MICSSQPHFLYAGREGAQLQPLHHSAASTKILYWEVGHARALCAVQNKPQSCLEQKKGAGQQTDHSHGSHCPVHGETQPLRCLGLGVEADDGTVIPD